MIILVLLTELSGASAAQQESDKRIIGGVTVDLTPLINWEKTKRGERPLTNWFHIKGTLQSENAAGWVLHADLGGNKGKGKQIILKNAPKEDAAEFARLEAQLNELNRQRAKLERRAEQPVEDRTVMTRRGVRKVRDPRRNDVAEAKAELKDVNPQIKELEKKIAKFPNSGGKFLVDCYALRTGQAFEGIPVYDCGYPVQS